MESLSNKKRSRSDSDESGLDSVEAKRILLDILYDSDINPVSQDLDSFIKTFQDEISPFPEPLTSESGDSQPELGFLFDASDDELGLPPSNSERTRDLAESVEVSELWGLDDNILLSYDSFEYEYEYGYGDVNYGNGSEYVAIDGLFDHTDLGFGSSDLLWRPETLPAQ